MSIKENLTQGLAQGLGQGFNTGTAASGGPAETLEGYLGHEVTKLWIDGNLADEKDGLTLTNTSGGVDVNQALAGTIDGGGITDGMWVFDDDADALVVPNLTDLQATASGNKIWLAVLRWTDTPAGDVFGTRAASSGNPGFEVRRPNTTSFGHAWDDGGTAIFGSALGQAAVNTWHVIAIGANESSNLYCLADSDGLGDSTSNTQPMGDMTSTRGFSIGDGRTIGARFQCAMFLYLEGSQATPHLGSSSDLRDLCLDIHQWVIDGTPP